MRHVSGEKEAMVPWHNCSRDSMLHTKVVMIAGTSIKRRLTWESGNSMGHDLGEVGLPTE